MSAALATEVLARLRPTYEAARDPARAPAMVAYMRDRFPFLGIGAPTQKVLARTVTAGLPAPGEDDLRAVALACWELPEREYQYFACGYLRRHVRALSADFLPVARQLTTTRPWWDTVDPLASRVVGPLVAAYPSLVTTMDAWLVDEDLWLIRSAILHQLFYREATDRARLFGYCTRQAGHRDFFVRKAIGWALREYAKTDPAAIRTYVASNRHRLSGLSVREATKNL
jgi:3-methyladenine DNA glycosylase AlkD